MKKTALELKIHSAGLIAEYTWWNKWLGTLKKVNRNLSKMKQSERKKQSLTGHLKDGGSAKWSSMHNGSGTKERE